MLCLSRSFQNYFSGWLVSGPYGVRIFRPDIFSGLEIYYFSGKTEAGCVATFTSAPRRAGDRPPVGQNFFQVILSSY